MDIWSRFDKCEEELKQANNELVQAESIVQEMRDERDKAIDCGDEGIANTLDFYIQKFNKVFGNIG